MQKQEAGDFFVIIMVKRKEVEELNIEPKRGDIFYICKEHTVGCEQEAGRPAVIVSNDTGNQHASIVMVVYLTTRTKNPLPTHVQLVAKALSTALCEQITTVSKDRLGGYIRTCSDREMCYIDEALMRALGIDPAEFSETKNTQDEEEKKKLYKLEAERDLYKGYFEKLAGIA